jgi:uncharacterized protein YbjQ (UPF0145 family)
MPITTPGIEGRTVTEYLGVVIAQGCARGQRVQGHQRRHAQQHLRWPVRVL